jgi:hypothetical protein
MTCTCFFCEQGQPHPARHTNWYAISHQLLVAESLDPAHSIPMKACDTCGHKEPA